MVESSVESLTAEIGRLVGVRQDLRASGANAAALEANRIELARAQRRLSYLLIARYRPAPAA